MAPNTILDVMMSRVSKFEILMFLYGIPIYEGFIGNKLESTDRNYHSSMCLDYTAHERTFIRIH